MHACNGPGLRRPNTETTVVTDLADGGDYRDADAWRQAGCLGLDGGSGGEGLGELERVDGVHVGEGLDVVEVDVGREGIGQAGAHGAERAVKSAEGFAGGIGSFRGAIDGFAYSRTGDMSVDLVDTLCGELNCCHPGDAHLDAKGQRGHFDDGESSFRKSGAEASFHFGGGQLGRAVHVQVQQVGAGELRGSQDAGDAAEAQIDLGGTLGRGGVRFRIAAQYAGEEEPASGNDAGGEGDGRGGVGECDGLHGSSADGDGGDLNWGLLGHSGDAHGGAGGEGACEDLRIHLVHGGIVFHAAEIGVGIDDVGHGHVSGFDDGLDVGQALASLIGGGLG